MAKIKEIRAHQIFDSRGTPTIETKITLDDGTVEKSSVPSGASLGKYEAIELRDGEADKFHGMGVQKAVDNVNNTISKSIVGMEVTSQAEIDRLMITIDGTPNKAKLGANAILSVSQAVAKTAAKSLDTSCTRYINQLVGSSTQLKIPIPMFNLIEGGKHANNVLDFQEFLVIPASSKSYSEALSIGISIYTSIKTLIHDRGMSTLVADEGGFCPKVASNRSALTFLKEAIDQSGISFALDVFAGLDCAANSFLDGKSYKIIDKPSPYSASDLISFYQELFADFSLIYMEDPIAEDDIDGWKKIHEALGDKTLIVGDDLVTTNAYRLEQALENKLIGGVIIKPNQVGTVTETIAVAEIARFKNLKTIVSHRSGETEDTFIADFAVGIGADYVKFGAPARERIIKYNRLLEIERELLSK